MFRSQMEILLKIMIFPFSSIECYNHDYIADLANIEIAIKKNLKIYYLKV